MIELAEKLEKLAKECGDSKFYAVRKIRDRIHTILVDNAKKGEMSRDEIGEKVKEAILDWLFLDVPYDNKLTERILNITRPTPAAPDGLREGRR